MASADTDLTSRPYWQDPSALNPTNAAARIRADQPADDLDDLLNYDVDINDLSRGANAEATNFSSRLNARNNIDNDNSGLGLGIDEEIKVRKPRAPIAKLDEERLLSAKGIPKLRRIAKDKFKFKGKGHEFTDVSRLLNNYQLWLDDLFPKAKFADGLAIIEKLGHKKRLQVMRKEWIDEGKPTLIEVDGSDSDREFIRAERNDTTSEEQNVEAPTQDQRREDHAEKGNADMDEDIYAEPTPPPSDLGRQETSGPQHDVAPAQEPDFDELDDLLAEDARNNGNDNQGSTLAPMQTSARDIFADEEEAMAEMGDMW